MLRHSLSLLTRVSPRVIIQPTCHMSRRAGMHNRVYRPYFLEVNRRRDIVELDNKLKNKDAIARRSSFSDWNYTAEVKALQVSRKSIRKLY